jgi:hypothetical protein
LSTGIQRTGKFGEGPTNVELETMSNVTNSTIKFINRDISNQELKEEVYENQYNEEFKKQ